MHADSHFVIGQAHVNGGKPCQDYAVAGELPGRGAYAIVADGCSSGGRTDVGARVIALATEQEFRHFDPNVHSMMTNTNIGALRSAVKSRQRFSLQLAKELMGLEQVDLLATCNYIFHSLELTLVQIHGDGVVAERFPDGHICMTRIDWLDNTPVYPAYMLDDYAGFVAHHGGDVWSERLTMEHHNTDPDETGAFKDSALPMYLGLEGVHWQPHRDASQVAVFTDGVTQIEGVDWRDAVTELMTFKSTTGEFAKRRLNRFVKDSHKLGRGPIDDLAYAVIDLTPTSEVG